MTDAAFRTDIRAFSKTRFTETRVPFYGYLRFIFRVISFRESAGFYIKVCYFTLVRHTALPDIVDVASRCLRSVVDCHC